MQRRGFLWTTAGGVLGGLTGVSALAGCGTPSQLRLGDDEGRRLLARLEGGLHAVRSGPVDPRYNQNDAAARVARLGLEALVVADVGRAIPVGAEIPDALAERLHQELPVLAESATTYGTLLAGLSRTSRRHVEEHLRNLPDAPMQIAEWIDRQAGEQHVAYESRHQLRRLATHVTQRTRRQSLSAIIDDTLGKMERVMAHHGAPIAFARQAGSNAMLAGIWNAVEHGAGGRVPIHAQPQAVYAAPPPPQAGPGDPEIAVGATMLGAGLGVFGIGVLIGAAVGDAAGGAIVTATPAGVAVIIGLIVLIVGLSQNG
jgi:hypothetical protein